MSLRLWGLHKAVCMFTTIAALYMLDYTFPIIAKLSKTLQTKQLHLIMIVSLVKAVLKTLDVKEDLEQITGEETENISSFQETVAMPFMFNLKENIKSV